MKSIRLTFFLLATLAAASAGADGSHVICTAQPIVCTSFDIASDDRFDPFVQHLLVRQQIEALPLGAQITSFYLSYPSDRRSIEEIQIRYMDELQRRKASEDTAEPAGQD
ncbi:MAG: hypothetical protein ACE5G3_03135 [Gammaproteobacteria bacterium]